MRKGMLFISATILITASLLGPAFAKDCRRNTVFIHTHKGLITDTVPPPDVMDIVAAAIYSLNTFSIEKVAALYTPNAVIADDEPPYSWNGPTAGVQWVNAVEQVCKDNRLTKLKGTIEAINVFQQTTDNVYIVVPVNYSGELPGKTHFTSRGAFTFVLRMINGRWMIKSQVWMPKKGM
jgi:hypothetical protein